MSYIGSSTIHSTEFVVAKMRERKPRSILDVGCGWGRWGFLAREFLELWEHNYQRDQWRVRIDAIDVHDGTWTPVHSFIYDHLYKADVRFFETSQRYDLVIACDVLEHIPKPAGVALVNRFREAGSSLVIGVPLGDRWPLYDGFDGNDFAGHVCHWFVDDLPDAEHVETLTEDNLPYGLFYLR